MFVFVLPDKQIGQIRELKEKEKYLDINLLYVEKYLPLSSDTLTTVAPSNIPWDCLKEDLDSSLENSIFSLKSKQFILQHKL